MCEQCIVGNINLAKLLEDNSKRSPVERPGYKALYGIDFKSKKEEIRLQLEAVNLEQAKKRAREIIGRRFKMKEACCVR